MPSSKGSGSGGGGGSSSGGRKGQPSGSNWDDHNLNSPNRVDQTRKERRLERIDDLRTHRVPERELSVSFEVSDDRTQGPVIDPMIKESSRLHTLWKWKRHEYFHMALFGYGTEAEKEAIVKFIDVRIKPRIKELAAEVIALRGRPMLPPFFYVPPLDKMQLSAPAHSMKGKGKATQ